jgi:hypothetical protein
LQSELSTPAFLRVRIGVGRPPAGWDAADYVLSPVPEDCRDAFESAVSLAAYAVLDILRDGFDKASTRWNMKRKASPPQSADGEHLLAPGIETGGLISRKEEHHNR